MVFQPLAHRVVGHDAIDPARTIIRSHGLHRQTLHESENEDPGDSYHGYSRWRGDVHVGAAIGAPAPRSSPQVNEGALTECHFYDIPAAGESLFQRVQGVILC